MILKDLIFRIDRLMQFNPSIIKRECPQLLTKSIELPSVEQMFEEYNYHLDGLVNLTGLATMNNELCLEYTNDCVNNLEECRNSLEKVRADQRELKKGIIGYAVERALNEREEIH